MKQGNVVNRITLDAGNTRIKCGLWINDSLQSVVAFSSIEDPELRKLASEHVQTPCIISSVLSYEETSALHRLFPGAVLFTHQTPIPLKNNYKQPETLGIDRLANAIGAFHTAKKAALVIDLGTCLKIDLVDKHGVYQGGSISPGLNMRLKSLHEFTGRLPLLEPHKINLLGGQTTEESCLSGVLNGMTYEIEGFYLRYSQLYPELTIFLTGGDASYFDLDFKNPIFANENLTHLGLLLTLQHIHA